MKDGYWLGLAIVLGNVLILRPLLAAGGVPPNVLWPVYYAVFAIGFGLQLRGLVLLNRRVRAARRSAEAFIAALTQFEQDRKTMTEDEAFKRLTESLQKVNEEAPGPA